QIPLTGIAGFATFGGLACFALSRGEFVALGLATLAGLACGFSRRLARILRALAGRLALAGLGIAGFGRLGALARFSRFAGIGVSHITHVGRIELRGDFERFANRHVGDFTLP